MRRQAKLEFRLLTGGALLLALAVPGCEAGNADLQRTEPGPDGEMAFVGVEYIVPIEEWEGEELPMLFGETFRTVEDLGVHVLHVWIGRDNPRGVFADWNPEVTYTKSPRLSLKLL